MDNIFTSGSADCDQSAPSLLSVDEARKNLLDYVNTVTEIEYLPIKMALKRIIAVAVHSSISIPSFDNSAMDGYALKHADLDDHQKTGFTLAGKSFAGAPYTGRVHSGECIRIMTGATLPDDCDTVIMQEHTLANDDKIFIKTQACKGQNVRYIGEDIKQGDEVLATGKLIQAAECGILASIGQAEVAVFRRLKVAFFSTGDELCSVGSTLSLGQIYDSNRYIIYSMLTNLGVDAIDMGVIPDDRTKIEEAFKKAADISDVIVTSGGVSVGEADYVKETLEKLGEVNFWKVAMKPGKPMAIGKIKNSYFMGLPGNPVSTMATFYQFVQPALNKLMGHRKTTLDVFKAVCTHGLTKIAGRAEFQRGTLTRNANGEMEVAPSGMQGSHILTSMSNANCFILLAAENTGVKPGETVKVQPFWGLL